MIKPKLSIIYALLAAPPQGNLPAPPAPEVPQEILKALENDFVLTDTEWNRDYQKIVQEGVPAFNGILKYVADRPWLTLSPPILEQFLPLKGRKGIDNESLEKILARQQKMPEILQKLVNEVNKGDPTHLSGDEWNNVLQKILGPSGFSALTVFLPYMAQTGKTIDPEVKAQLQALASRGWVNRMVLDRIRIPIPPGKEAKSTIIKIKVDDESFRQYQVRAESKSPQSAGEELLRKSQDRIKVVFERASRRDSSWNITKIDVTLTVNNAGRVTQIKFVPNLDSAPEGFVDGLRDIMKYWLFPAGGEVKFPLIFQASGG